MSTGANLHLPLPTLTTKITDRPVSRNSSAASSKAQQQQFIQPAQLTTSTDTASSPVGSSMDDVQRTLENLASSVYSAGGQVPAQPAQSSVATSSAAETISPTMLDAESINNMIPVTTVSILMRQSEALKQENNRLSESNDQLKVQLSQQHDHNKNQIFPLIAENDRLRRELDQSHLEIHKLRGELEVATRNANPLYQLSAVSSMELQKEQIPAKSHTPESSVRNNRHPGEDGGSDDGAVGSSVVPFAVPGIDGQPAQFGCPAPGCMLSFSSYPLCDAHFQSHDLKQFVCTHPGCGKSFKRNHDMKRHAKQHEGLKAYKCDKCGKEFGRSDALRRHERKIDCESEDGSYRLKRRKREDGTEGDMDGGGDADMGSEGMSQEE